ncbi:hypothetical protein IA69_15500 [Massilia sp. JS1662]|nr:hypothetical protein [Massilia sp. JS1662]KGF80922.1 hypothetical protein IA69_15500 [Massilia sp. JS1662]
MSTLLLPGAVDHDPGGEAGIALVSPPTGDRRGIALAVLFVPGLAAVAQAAIRVAEVAAHVTRFAPDPWQVNRSLLANAHLPVRAAHPLSDDQVAE